MVKSLQLYADTSYLSPFTRYNEFRAIRLPLPKMFQTTSLRFKANRRLVVDPVTLSMVLGRTRDIEYYL